MTPTPPIHSLMALGFTALEAEVYVSLLTEPSATGYRVANAIGKPTANVYKAIESLQTKGAVLVDDGERRVCRAVPAEELLRQLERDFRHRRERAADTLAHLGKADVDDRVYQIRSKEQVLERCRTMLAGAEEIVLADLYPGPLDTFRGDLEATAARGVDVWAKIYAPDAVDGVEVVQPVDVDRIVTSWPGHLNLVVDGREMLLVMLDRESNLLQAVWTRSTYLACMFHSGLGCELMLSKAQNAATRNDPALAKRWFAGHDRLFLSRSPGYRALMDRFTRSEAPERSRKESPK